MPSTPLSPATPPARQALIALLIEAEAFLTDHSEDDSECRFDHHGNCQEHGWRGGIATCLKRQAHETLTRLYAALDALRSARPTPGESHGSL